MPIVCVSEQRLTRERAGAEDGYIDNVGAAVVLDCKDAASSEEEGVLSDPRA